MTRPGIAKARGLPLVHAHRTTLVQAPEGRWRELFERADVVSEGAVRQEASGRVWYGTTSVILRSGPERTAFLASVIERDLHARLRAVRLAHREASLRAPGLLGRLSCEIRVTADPEGVRIDVDAQAPLIERRARTRRA